MPKLTPNKLKKVQKGDVVTENPSLRELPPIRDPMQIMHYDKTGTIRNARIIDFDGGEDMYGKGADNTEYDRYARLFVFPFVTEARLQFFNGEHQVVRRVSPKREKAPEPEPGEDVFG